MTSPVLENDLKAAIRTIPDYPKPGILFYDLTTLLKDKDGFHTLIDRLCEHFRGRSIDIVARMEARGFICAPALAFLQLRSGPPLCQHQAFYILCFLRISPMRKFIFGGIVTLLVLAVGGIGLALLGFIPTHSNTALLT